MPPEDNIPPGTSCSTMYGPSDASGELNGIGVMVTVLETMTPDARRRALAYLGDRYGDRNV